MPIITKGKLIEPSPIQNATVQEILKNNGLYAYSIRPVEGYVLHDSRVDEEVVDPVTYEGTGEFIPGFLNGMCTVKSDYDFNDIEKGTYSYTDENGEAKTIEVLKVGQQKIYAIPFYVFKTI